MDLSKLVSKLDCSGVDDIDANEVFGIKCSKIFLFINTVFYTILGKAFKKLLLLCFD